MPDIGLNVASNTRWIHHQGAWKVPVCGVMSPVIAAEVVYVVTVRLTFV